MAASSIEDSGVPPALQIGMNDAINTHAPISKTDLGYSIRPQVSAHTLQDDCQTRHWLLCMLLLWQWGQACMACMTTDLL